MATRPTTPESKIATLSPLVAERPWPKTRRQRSEINKIPKKTKAHDKKKICVTRKKRNGPARLTPSPRIVSTRAKGKANAPSAIVKKNVPRQIHPARSTQERAAIPIDLSNVSARMLKNNVGSTKRPSESRSLVTSFTSV